LVLGCECGLIRIGLPLVSLASLFEVLTFSRTSLRRQAFLRYLRPPCGVGRPNGMRLLRAGVGCDKARLVRHLAQRLREKALGFP
jgi:hypothetical protein